MKHLTEVPDRIVQDYYANPAAFTKYFTNLWFDDNGNGAPQDIYQKQVIFLNNKMFPTKNWPDANIIVVLKPRQSGFSSAAVARVIHNAYFGMRPEFMIMSRTKQQAGKILRRIRSAYNSMPEELRPEFSKETEHQLILPNNTVIYSIPAKPESARGYTGDVYLDEFGTFGAREGVEIWEAIFPSTTKGYKIFVIGTPKGKNNFFYHLSTKTLAEISKSDTPIDAYRIRIHWSEVPHIAANIHNLKAGMSPLSFEQEYELKFLDETDEIFFTQEFIYQYLIDKDRGEEDLLRFSVFNKETGFKNGIDEADLPEEIKYHFLKDKYSEIYAGWDLAKKHDSSVVSIMGKRRSDGVVELIGMEFLDGLDYLIQAKIVSIICQMAFVKKLGYDHTGGGGVVEEMIRQTKIGNIAHPVDFSNKWKWEAYSNLRTMMYQGQIKAPETEKIMDQFSKLEHDPVSNKIGAMVGAFDDIPSSFIIAIDAMRKKRPVARISFL